LKKKKAILTSTRGGRAKAQGFYNPQEDEFEQLDPIIRFLRTKN